MNDTQTLLSKPCYDNESVLENVFAKVNTERTQCVTRVAHVEEIDPLHCSHTHTRGRVKHISQQGF